MRNEVSLCMIVKNEEKYLPKCLESVKDVVDEIIIVDTGSTDKTVDIAKSYGAKVYFYKWNNNFSEARNESLKYATKDWILILDADDELRGRYKKNLKLLLDTNLDENLIYCFETLNYYGNRVDENNITININPRMFRNGRGIHYEGEIHNQLIFKGSIYEEGICEEIKIYHYGYLDKTIEDKDKRNRNISILKEKIKNNPNSKFNYFNMGSEYMALGDARKALECYYKAYENFNPRTGFSSILLLRIIMANYNIKEYKKALEFADIAINYYERFTDAYFLKGIIYRDLGQTLHQIENLKKCIEIGEAPNELRFFYGTGEYKAYYELGNAYLKVNDLEEGYNCIVKAINVNPDFLNSFYIIARILKMKNVPIDEFKVSMEKLFSNFPDDYVALAELFYSEGFYKAAAEYVNKYEIFGGIEEKVIKTKVKSLIRTGGFQKCMKLQLKDDSTDFNTKLSLYKLLASIIIKDYNYAQQILNNLEKENLSDYDKKMLKVYAELLKLFMKEENDIISEDENDEEYIFIIIEVCEILLINKRFEELKSAVTLFNLINNKYALLYLGKLYYSLGYFDFAKKELIRSIKEFEIFDFEGLDILKVLCNK